MKMMTTRQVPVQAARWPARVGLLAATFALGIAASLHARAQAPDADPPGRVARLSDVVGQVWIYSADSNEWVGIDRNRPLTTGDHIATDNGARAELALGTTRLRLDSATELEIVQLDDRRFVVHLVGGSVDARLRRAEDAGEFELDTDEGQFHAQAAGRYRFDRFQQASEITVDAGQAVFDGRNSQLVVAAGQHAQFWLDAGGAPQYSMLAPARDDFVAWNDQRDYDQDRVAQVRYVSPEMTGADDLDRYGAWEQTPEYGAIWTPRGVAVDWAPYRTGHWAFVRPWGWTWVDDAPWGFAPFHYGRWVRYHEAWGWAPGTYVARPIYAPALVAWIGGPRVGVSISVGGRGGPPVGWFPLAPHEVYVPSYRTSERYVRDVNITHVTNITNITTVINNSRSGEGDRREFANRRFPNAVTIVPASVMTSRQDVGRAAARYRDDPQVRSLVTGARPGPALAAAPVSIPPTPSRAALQSPPSRPPFETRVPGNSGGRSDVGRGDVGRGDVGRGNVGRGEGGRPGERVGQVPADAGERLNGAPPNGVGPSGARPLPPRAGPPAMQPSRESGPATAIAPQRLEPGAQQRVIPPSPARAQINEPPMRARADGMAGRNGEPARIGEPARVEGQRPTPIIRSPEAVRPMEPARVVEPRSQAQLPPGQVPSPAAPGQAGAPVPQRAGAAADPRGAHVETPRAPREERRDERRDPNDKQQPR